MCACVCVCLYVVSIFSMNGSEFECGETVEARTCLCSAVFVQYFPLPMNY